MSSMIPEEKALLEKAVSLSEENNKILRGIQRGNRWGTAFRVFYWLVIIGVSFGVYVSIQPYIDKVLKTFDGVTGTINQVTNIGR